jgi:hypothetical protein
MSRNRNRNTPPPADNVIDPSAEVDLDAFAGDDVGDDADPDFAVVEEALDAKTDAEMQAAIAPAAPPATRRPATDVALRVAAEIANEALRKHPQTATELIAFHDFVLARIKDAQDA